MCCDGKYRNALKQILGGVQGKVADNAGTRAYAKRCERLSGMPIDRYGNDDLCLQMWTMLTTDRAEEEWEGREERLKHALCEGTIEFRAGSDHHTSNEGRYNVQSVA